MIQKEFKVTPDYLEVAEHDSETGYHMGVYLCLGQHVHGLKHCNSVPIKNFKCYTDVHNYMSKYGKVFVFMGEGKHKIKKKAEQFACDEAIRILEQFQSSAL